MENNIIKITQVLSNAFTILGRKIDALTAEVRSKKQPPSNVSVSISEDVSKGISEAVGRSLDKLKIPTPQINVPEQKVPKIPAPIVNVEAPIVNVPPANITVEPTKVEFPKEMKVEGMDKLLESVNRETPSGNIFDKVSHKNPLPMIILDAKGKQITDFGSDITAPSTISLRVGTT